jgi:hypothetical protein
MVFWTRIGEQLRGRKFLGVLEMGMIKLQVFDSGQVHFTSRERAPWSVQVVPLDTQPAQKRQPWERILHIQTCLGLVCIAVI